ncbi:MAG: acyltransferase [Cyanobium sp.]
MSAAAKGGFIHPSVSIGGEGLIQIPASTIIEAGSVIAVQAGASLLLGERNTIYPNCTFRLGQGTLRTGLDVSFGPGVVIYEPRADISIGDHCLIAAGVMMCGAGHQFTALDLPIRQQPMWAAPIAIEDDVWLGMGAILLPGVQIGRGAVIGAGSVVTQSIPAAVVAYGSPCKPRRYRDGSPLSGACPTGDTP